jgi:hypothetical protein
MIQTHVIVALMAAAAAAAGTWQIQSWRIEAIHADHARKALEATELARVETQKLQEIKDEALRMANARASQHRIAADGARTELDRLRDTIATADKNQPPNTSRTDAAATARAILADCAAQYQSVARAADGHYSDAVTLQSAWPR